VVSGRGEHSVTTAGLVRDASDLVVFGVEGGAAEVVLVGFEGMEVAPHGWVSSLWSCDVVKPGDEAVKTRVHRQLLRCCCGWEAKGGEGGHGREMAFSRLRSESVGRWVVLTWYEVVARLVSVNRGAGAASSSRQKPVRRSVMGMMAVVGVVLEFSKAAAKASVMALVRLGLCVSAVVVASFPLKKALVLSSSSLSMSVEAMAMTMGGSRC